MDNALTQNMQPDLFPVLSEIPQAKRNCRLRCQGEAGRSDTSGRFSIRLLETLRGRSCQPAFPPLAPATGTSAAAMRPRAPARSAHTYQAPAVPLAGPPRCTAHQLAHARRARALLLGRLRSSPHKERRLSIRVNLAGPRANTIGRVFTNEVSLRLR